MSGYDLWELLTQRAEYKAESEALREVLKQERDTIDKYIESVDLLIAAQEAERQEFMKQSNKSYLELYLGYGTQDKLEGGVRLIWRLK